MTPLPPEDAALLEALEAELRKPEPRPMRTFAERVLQNADDRRSEAAKMRRVK